MISLKKTKKKKHAIMYVAAGRINNFINSYQFLLDKQIPLGWVHW